MCPCPNALQCFISDLSSHLDAANSHPPSLRHCLLSSLQYADDVVLMSLTGIGRQRLLKNLPTYYIENETAVNFGKTQVVGVWKEGQKKEAGVWVESLSLEGQGTNTLGSGCKTVSYRLHLSSIKPRIASRTAAFRSLQHKLQSPTLSSLLTVIKAKFIPTISFGIEVFPVKLGSFLNSAPSKVFRPLFHLPQKDTHLWTSWNLV